MAIKISEYRFCPDTPKNKPPPKHAKTARHSAGTPFAVFHFTFSVKCPAQNHAIAKLESAALKIYFTALLKPREVNNITAASNYKNYAENSRRGFYKNIQTNSAAVSRGKIIYNNVLYVHNIIKCNRPPAAEFPMTPEGGKPRTFPTVRMRLAEILAPSPPPPKPREIAAGQIQRDYPRSKPAKHPRQRAGDTM
jgi:hypothetical protein